MESLRKARPQGSSGSIPGHVLRARTANLMKWLAPALLMLALTSNGGAAEQPQGEASEPAELTLPAVEARLTGIQESSALEEAVQTKLVETYTSVLEQLRLAQQWQQKALQFEQDRERAPDRVKEIEAALAAPPQEPQAQAPEDATLAELGQLLSQAEAQLAALVAERAELEAESSRRAERRKRVPDLIVDASRRLEEARTQTAGPADAAQAPEIAEARRLLAAARVQAIEAEKGAYETELRSYEARGRLLTLRQDLAARRVSEHEKLVAAWRRIVSSSRQEGAQQAAKEASEALVQADKVSPLVREIAQELAAQNAALVDRRTGPDGLVRKIEEASRSEGELEGKLIQVSTSFKDVKAKAEAVPLTHAVGLLLRKHGRELPDPRFHRARVRKRNDIVAHMQFEQMEFQEQRRGLADIDGLVNTTLAGLPLSIPEDHQEALAGTLRELYMTKRASLDALLEDVDAYIDMLLRVQLKEQQLIDETEKFAAYIGERVLWIRSGRPIQLSDFIGAGHTVLWLADGRKWRATLVTLGSDVRAHMIEYGFALLIFGLGLIARRRATKHIDQVSESARKPTCQSVGLTAEVFVATVVAAVVPPAVLWFLGWRLGFAAEGGAFERAVASGLTRAAIVAFALELPRQVLRRQGLADAHFGWPARSLQTIRRHLGWFMPIAVSAAFVISVLEWAGDERQMETLGRFVTVAAMAAFAFFAHLVMRPGTGPVAAGLDLARKRRVRHFGTACYLVVVGIPVALGVLACAGYHFTALRLSWHFHGTVLFGVGLLVLRGLVLRWVLLTHRRLARDQARKRRETQKAKGLDGEQPESSEEEAPLDLAEVDLRTQGLIRSMVLLILILGVWLIWADVLPALRILNRVELWHTTQQVGETVRDAEGEPLVVTREELVPVTLAHLGLAILVAGMSLVLVRNLPGLLEMTLLQRLPLAPGERYAITSLIGYSLVVAAVILVFHIIGIGWAKVQWLVAALGLGLGFGLQEIFANFVSGLIILFEQPVRVGDTVTIGGVSGTVSRIRIRATTITDFDRKELIVPNKEFVTGQLVNWTLSDMVLRVIIPVGIAYGSDTELAVQILKRVALDNANVLDNPEPHVLFWAFGDSSLNFELRVYVKSSDVYLQARHELHMEIDRAFREAGIVIAFPQQDVHLYSTADTLPLMDNPPEKKGSAEET